MRTETAQRTRTNWKVWYHLGGKTYSRDFPNRSEVLIWCWTAPQLLIRDIQIQLLAEDGFVKHEKDASPSTVEYMRNAVGKKAKHKW